MYIILVWYSVVASSECSRATGTLRLHFHLSCLQHYNQLFWVYIGIGEVPWCGTNGAKFCQLQRPAKANAPFSQCQIDTDCTRKLRSLRMYQYAGDWNWCSPWGWIFGWQLRGQPAWNCQCTQNWGLDQGSFVFYSIQQSAKKRCSASSEDWKPGLPQLDTPQHKRSWRPHLWRPTVNTR